MQMPTIHGKLNQSQFFVFTACDSIYFDQYAKPLINSIIKNTNYGIHIHIYNPRDDQLAFCNNVSRLSITYEYLDISQFSSITNKWLTNQPVENVRQQQMFDKGQRFGATFLQDLILKTYYACARFVRLSQLLPEGNRCLAIDIDGIVRGNFNTVLNNDSDTDIFLYQKPSGEHLAGALLFTASSSKFLQHYGLAIEEEIKKDNIYWFLDQYVLDIVVKQYRTGLLPMSYVDWEMNATSSIWSAKGKRKELAVFKAEQLKYNF